MKNNMEYTETLLRKFLNDILPSQKKLGTVILNKAKFHEVYAFGKREGYNRCREVLLQNGKAWIKANKHLLKQNGHSSENIS